MAKKASKGTTVRKPSKAGLTSGQKEILGTLHPELQEMAVSMLQAETEEKKSTIQHRWEWGQNVDQACNEKKYGEGQVEALAEFLSRTPKDLWLFRRFYRVYSTKSSVNTLATMQLANGRPLSWSMIVEVLRNDFDDKVREQWLAKACKNNWSASQLRQQIQQKNAKSSKSKVGSMTPNRVLKKTDKQAENFTTNAEEFDQTLEERLLNGNAEDFTDDIMEQLETTQASLREMQGTISLHLDLVERCLTRGQQLREEVDAEEEEEVSDEDDLDSLEGMDGWDEEEEEEEEEEAAAV